MNPTELQARLDFTVEIAREAGALTLPHFLNEQTAVERKGDRSPVTEADRQAERRLRERIAERYAADAILGEEFGETPGTSGATWILDPLDGTQSFIHGVPLFGTLVGLEAEGEAVLGVAYFPALGELVYAAKGLGAWWLPPGASSPTPRRAQVSTVYRLDEALLTVTWLEGFERIGRLDLYERLRQATALERGWGDCYGHILVATGRAELMVDPVMNVWDCAALKPILEEAGGTFTDLAGTPTIRGGSAISTNGHLFDAVMQIVRSDD
jgi:histidinol phosphatase-like enzyme (inositol monophosphatase family)